MRVLKTGKLTDFELYDLGRDVEESSDRVPDGPDVLSRLKAKLIATFEEIREEAPVWPAWKWPRYEARRIKWPNYKPLRKPPK